MDGKDAQESALAHLVQPGIPVARRGVLLPEVHRRFLLGSRLRGSPKQLVLDPHQSSDEKKCTVSVWMVCVQALHGPLSSQLTRTQGLQCTTAPSTQPQTVPFHVKRFQSGRPILSLTPPVPPACFNYKTVALSSKWPAASPSLGPSCQSAPNARKVCTSAFFNNLGTRKTLAVSKTPRKPRLGKGNCGENCRRCQAASRAGDCSRNEAGLRRIPPYRGVFRRVLFVFDML